MTQPDVASCIHFSLAAPFQSPCRVICRFLLLSQPFVIQAYLVFENVVDSAFVVFLLIFEIDWPFQVESGREPPVGYVDFILGCIELVIDSLIILFTTYVPLAVIAASSWSE